MASKNRRFADDGWAIWITGEDTSTIYLNHWVNPKGKSYVDVGVRVSGINGPHSVNLYIPYQIDKEDIEDVSHRLQSPTTFRAVLNSTGLMDYKKNDCTSELALRGRTMDLIHLSALHMNLVPMASGTHLQIPLYQLEGKLDNDEALILFRIPHKSLDEIFTSKADVESASRRFRDLITSPVLDEKYGCSVRINEGRMLPQEVNAIGAFHRQKLKKAAISIALHENYRINDSNCYRIRRLEENLYGGYAPESHFCEDHIIYQWSQDSAVNQRGQFSFYISMARESISKTSLFIYLVLLVIFGAAGNGLWTLIQFTFFQIVGR